MSTPEGRGTQDAAPHVDDELLAAVAMDDEVDLATRAHLDSCARCAGEVEALRETLAMVVAAGHESLVEPPASVWAGVAVGITESEPAPVTSLAERRRGVPTWLAVTAASVTLAVGVGVGAVVMAPTDDPAPATEVLGTAALASLEASAQDRGAAQVRRVDDRVVLHVEAADLDGPDGTREVWLINTDGTRMVSLGLLPAGERGEFDFPERLLDQGYRIVDISYEPDDGDPVHSGQSLARGTIEG